MNWRRRGPLVLFILIGIFLLVARGAWSARVDCGPLLKASADAGVTPTLYLDPDYGVARLESGADHCLEPIEEWRRRGVALKSSGKPPRPQAEADESPAPAPAPATPAAAPRESAPPAPPPPPRPIEKAELCDRNIGEFWRGTLVDVGGVGYSLVRVYTIDLDSDNRVDDVGFRLKAQDKPDLAISYLGGDLPAATLPELQLSDEGVIERLCFETRSFEMLKTSSQGMPDLAADIKSSMKIKASPKKEAAAESVTADDESSPWIWVILGLSVLLVGGGGAAWFFLIRGRAGDDGDDDDDDDDDDDEEEDDDD